MAQEYCAVFVYLTLCGDEEAVDYKEEGEEVKLEKAKEEGEKIPYDSDELKVR